MAIIRDAKGQPRLQNISKNGKATPTYRVLLRQKKIKFERR